MNTLFLRSLAQHKVIRHSAVVFAGSMSVNVMAYLFHLLVGRILGPGPYGEFSALLSLFYILNTPTLVLQALVVKLFSTLKAKGATGEAKSLFLFITRWMVIAGGIGLLCMIGLAGTLATFLHIRSPEYFLWLYGLFVFYLLGIVNVSILQAYQKFAAMSLFTNLSGLLRLILGVIFAYWGVGWTLISNVFSGLLGYIALFIPLGFLLAVKAKPHTISHRDTVGYSIPTFFAFASITALYTQDVLWVKHFFSPVDAGLYASLSVLGKVIFFASAALTSVAFPLIAERKVRGASSSRLVIAAFGIVAAMSIGLTLCYFLFPAFIVHLLFGPEYQAAEQYVGLFGLFISFFSLSNLLINVFLALGNTKAWVFSTLAAIAQGIGLVLYHPTFLAVIEVNITVTAALLVALLVYYRYGKS